jgi:arginine decarboxylase
MRLAGQNAPQIAPSAVTALRIRVAPGVGRGPTPLAAFDAALIDAGVANYNLICLSSVIPPQARIERSRHVTPAGDWGRRLYVVLSEMREDRPGRTACAGIGWVQDRESGRGLFVELHDSRRDRLARAITATLQGMQRNRQLDLGPVRSEISEVRCDGEPVCALVVAVYKCEPWEEAV